MTHATRKVLAALIAKRPAEADGLLLAMQTDLTANTVRRVCNELKNAGLAECREVRSQFIGVHPARHWRAMAHATIAGLAEAPGRPGVPDAQDEAVAAVLEARRPVSLREVREACGLSETYAARQLKAALEAGLVTRVLGPKPAVGSVRPWLWRAA